MDENKLKIILAIIALLTAIFGGALYSKRKSKSRKSVNIQKKIKIEGDNNRVIGRDDKSKLNDK